jgi:hypothetical protein
MPVSEPQQSQMTLSLAASGSSAWFMHTHRNTAAHIKVPAGDATGAFSIETSADTGASKDAVALAAGLAQTSGADPAAGPASKVIEFASAQLFSRVKYVRTSGGAALTATIIFTGRD